MDTNTRYLDIHGVCDRYSIGRRTVWRRVEKKILPPPIYFDGPQSGARWRLDQLEACDAQHERAVA